MNILVTGSNGFIGGHVSSFLKSKGHYVIGLGRRSQEIPWNYRGVLQSLDEYICCDLSTDEVYNIPKKVGVHIDAVIHLAADMRKEPHCVEVISANCCGTQRLLEMCESSGISTFLQLSSLPVIGHPIEHPITETHPLNPYTVYHITKRTEELLANYASDYRGVRTASFRISAPIGPRVNPDTIFPTFVRCALTNEDLVLFGQGSRRQNYVYVGDIARCLELSVDNKHVRGVYNLTSDLLISNVALAEMVIRTLNSKSVIKFEGSDAQDSYVWDASIEKIRRDAGYCPQAKMEDVIKEYADWLKA